MAVDKKVAARYETRLTDDERELWRAFSIAHAHLIKMLDDALRETEGLSLSGYEVLYALSTTPGNRLRMAELADRLLFTRGGVTRVVNRLEGLGYLRRGGVDDDLRGVTAELTDEGYRAFMSAARGHVGRIRTAFLDPVGADSSTFLSVLERLRNVGAGTARHTKTI